MIITAAVFFSSRLLDTPHPRLEILASLGWTVVNPL
jgi:hypothetical protein